MTSAQVVETSVTNNSSFQNYPHPDDHTIRIYQKNKSIKLQTFAWKVILSRLLVNLTQFITKSNLACSVANNDRIFFGFDIPRDHFKLISISKTRRRYGHTKNCINFIRRREICRVWDVSLSHYPSQCLRVFSTLWETVFREGHNHYVTSKSNWINLRFNTPPGVFRNTTSLNFKKISSKNSLF